MAKGNKADELKGSQPEQGPTDPEPPIVLGSAAVKAPQEPIGIKAPKPNDVQAPDPVAVPKAGDVKLSLQGATPPKAMRLLAEARETIKHIQVKNDFINRWLKEAD